MPDAFHSPASIYDPNPINLEHVSVGLRRSEIDGYVCRLICFIRIVPDAFHSPASIYDPNPINLENGSVGLRRSEIDGYFAKCFASFSLSGESTTPRSVMMAVTSFAGVESKAGLITLAASGTTVVP